MSKRFHRMFALPGFRIGAVLLLVSGMLIGQERRPPVLRGGAQQERRPPAPKRGAQQQDELPDEYSIITILATECREARKALDLYREAAANPELVMSDRWQTVEDRAYQALASCFSCPMGTLKIGIELLRRAQIARPNPRARGEVYERLIFFTSGQSPARRPVSLQAFDQAVQRWEQKIQGILQEAEECFQQSCVETLQLLTDGASGWRPDVSADQAPCQQHPLQNPLYLRYIGQADSSAPLRRSPQPNTEEQKAIIATVEGDPTRYRSINERSRYYDAVTRILASDPRTKNISFFRAANKVTDRRNLGAVEEFPGANIHNEASKELILAINERLFAANMAVIRRLFESGCPMDPFRPQSGPIPPLQFDLRMVEFEQGNVQKILDDPANRRLVQEGMQDINNDLNLNGGWDLFRPLANALNIPYKRPVEWAKSCLGKKDLDFSNLSHRVAVGKALIFMRDFGPGEEVRARYCEYMRSGQ
ncbi:MAG TPA: hypothetical protein VJ464_17950 [Blastocatellia bacterium]|nr:hypothetical protein [Blastocatellia bacterium]